MAEQQLYLTGKDAFKSYATEQTSEERVVPKGHARAFTDRTFVGYDTNISLRGDYHRGDYSRFRPTEAIPSKPKEIIKMCMDAYEKVGILYNVVNLMAEFGSQGIRLQHPIKTVENFYNAWFNKIRGSERSERFLNMFYRSGNVIVKKSYGKVGKRDESTWKRGRGADIELERQKVKSREIPLRYNILNPLSVEIIGEDLATFVGKPVYALQISTALRSAILRSSHALDKQTQTLLSKIPKDIKEAIKKGQKYIILDQDKIEVYSFKKDDWKVWAEPMCYPILNDLINLSKMKLADVSALDGALSSVRLWTLGVFNPDNPQASILPTRAGINKLRNILANGVGGGTIDLVWGPELTFTETQSQSWRWLGSEKYEATLSAIYEGLGIPPSMRTGKGSTNTGSFIGLNTLVKRLQYGRNALVSFWKKEIANVHKAMGFVGRPPEIVFDYMVLADEAAEKQLLIHLWDRDVISTESILEIFGKVPSVEQSRVKNEYNYRTKDKVPEKASPFHNPEKEHDYKKLLLQGGNVTPSELGVQLLPKKDGEENRLEQMEKTQVKLKQLEVSSRDKMAKQKPDGQSGRPKNVTETTKRKPKTPEKPSTKAFANLFIWAQSAQAEISKHANSCLLYAFNKNSMRELNKEEANTVERVKFGILCNIDPYTEITQDIIKNVINNNIPREAYGIIKTLYAQFEAVNDRQPKMDELRQMYATAYALYLEK